MDMKLTKLGQLVGGGQGAIVVEKDNLVLGRMVAGLKNMSNGQLGKGHAVIKLLRDSPQLVNKADAPVGCSVFVDITEELLMVALLCLLGHRHGLVDSISQLASVPRVHNNGA